MKKNSARFRNLFIHVGFILVANTSITYGAPASLTYQGRILKSDGKPLEYSNVSFLFQITSPNGLCILYEEQLNNVDMQNSGGVFDTPIGSGSRSFPTSGTASILDAFNNLAPSLPCKGGTTYTPSANDSRKLRVQFYDGVGWRLIAPDNNIRSVPYSGFSYQTAKLQGHEAQEFILKDTIPSCTSNTFLSWNGTTLSCEPIAGATGGTVTTVSSTNSYLTVSNGTTTPTLTLNVGAGPNTVAAGDDSRLTNSRAPVGAASGDLSGNYPNPTVAKIQGRAVDAAAPADGQVLLWDNGNTTWKTQYVRMQDIRNSWGGTQMIPSTACAANESMVWSVITDRFTCQAITLNGSAITAGTINSARLGSGTADNTTYLRGDGTWATISTSDATKLPLAGGTMTGNIDMNGNKILNAPNVPFVAANPAGTEDGKSLKWNNGTGQWEWFTASAAGSGIGTLNSQGGNSQTLAPTASVTSYGFTSAANTHTFSIPSAGTAGVIAGTISKTEYDAFSAKQTAGNYITTLTGDVTASGFTAGSVTTTIANNAVTSAKILDATIVGADMDFTGINTATSNLVMKDSTGKFYNFACATVGHVPTWTVTGFACQAPSITETDPKVGSNTTNMLSKWDGSALVASGVYESGGNVGIGTSSPTAKLEISGIAGVDGIKFPDGTTQTTASIAATYGVQMKSGSFMGPATGNYSVTGLGFKPTAVRFLVQSNREGTMSGVSISNCTGFMTDSSQYAYYTYTNNVASGARNYVYTDRAIYCNATDATTVQIQATYVSMNADGFTLNFGTSSAGYKVVWEALGGSTATSSGSGTTNYIPIWNSSTNLGSSPMAVSGGNVGIGTTSPAGPLHVVQTSVTPALTLERTGDANASVEFKSSTGFTAIDGGGSSGFLRFHTAGSPRMYINSSGNVGIGTTSPTNKLEVVGGTTKLEQEPWTYPSSFGGSWVNYGGAWGNFGYRKDSMGYLRLRGLIKNGTTGVVFFTLPTGYRPTVSMEFSVGAANGSSPGTANVIISSDGNIRIETMSSNGWVSFDNVSLPLD